MAAAAHRSDARIARMWRARQQAQARSIGICGIARGWRISSSKRHQAHGAASAAAALSMAAAAHAAYGNA